MAALVFPDASFKTDQDEALYEPVPAEAWEAFGVLEKTYEPDWEPIGADEIFRLTARPAETPANEGDAPPKRAFPTMPERGARWDASYFMKAMAMADWLVILAAAEIAARWGDGLGLAGLPIADAAALVAATLSLKAGLWLTGVYRTAPNRIGVESALGGLAIGAIGGLGLSAVIAPDARATAALAVTLPMAAIALAAVHAAFALWIHAAWKRGAFAETAIVIGATPTAERFIRRATKEGSLRVAAIVDDRADRVPESLANTPVAGGVDDLLGWEHLPKIDRIVIGVSHVADARVRALIDKLRAAPNRIDLLFDFDIVDARGRRLEQIGGLPLAIICGRSTSIGRAFAKRIQDLILASLLTIMFAPLMFVIAAAVKLDSQGPALFKQKRHGLNNKIITIWKFRTMRRDVCAEPTRQVCVNDPRLTRIGGFLRRTSLDELPQFFNVLKGDMSLVGPRPHAIDMRACDRPLHAVASDYAHRHRVKPGITGWAQIHGSRGPVETAEALKERIRLDLEYIGKASIWIDLCVLARTIPALFGDKKNIR